MASGVRATAVLVFALSLPSTALAQLFATVELEAPGNPYQGAVVTHVLFTDPSEVSVGEWSGFLFVVGSLAKVTFPVSDVPDRAEITFQVPLGGPTTVLVVDPLSLPDDFVLPDPSPGGEISPAAGDPATDAVVRVSVGSLAGGDDDTPPTCAIIRDGNSVDAEVQDGESGLAEIEIQHVSNLDEIEVPFFTIGTTDLVTLSWSVLDPEAWTRVLLDISDVAGNRTICKSVTQQSGGEEDPPLAGGEEESQASGVSAPALSPVSLAVLAGCLASVAALGLRRR